MNVTVRFDNTKTGASSAVFGPYPWVEIGTCAIYAGTRGNLTLLASRNPPQSWYIPYEGAYDKLIISGAADLPPWQHKRSLYWLSDHTLVDFAPYCYRAVLAQPRTCCKCRNGTLEQFQSTETHENYCLRCVAIWNPSFDSHDPRARLDPLDVWGKLPSNPSHG